MSSETTVLARFHHRHEAVHARGYLEEKGIRTALTADDGGGAFGAPLTFSPGSFATLSVRAEDRERARDLLEELGFGDALVD